MTYARDPYDTDQPPCMCGDGPGQTTPEFCPACGDPDKPAPEPPQDEARTRLAEILEQGAVGRWNEDGESLVLEIHLDDAVAAAQALLLKVWADIQDLAREYTRDDAIAAMPFLATLDQLLMEKYGVRTP